MGICGIIISMIISISIMMIIRIGLVESLGFNVESGHTKCISQDIQSNSMSVGKYKIVNPPLPTTLNITCRVTSSYGNTNHYADHVQSGQFSFLAVEAGDYMACFWAADHNPPATMTIDFEWKTGIAAKDWANVAKKGSVDAMELELKKLDEMVSSIHDEMFYLRRREEEMQDLNIATNSSMAWLSFLSLFVCLSVAGLQLWHLKSYFEKKKII